MSSTSIYSFSYLRIKSLAGRLVAPAADLTGQPYKAESLNDPNPFDHRWRLYTGNNLYRTTAVITETDIDIEHPLKSLCKLMTFEP